MKSANNSDLVMSVFTVADFAKVLGVKLAAGQDDIAVAAALLTAAQAMARRDWAVRVLDAWGEMAGRAAPQPEYFHARKAFTVAFYHGPQLAALFKHDGETRDAARLAAAESVWPELPESVRAELGERP